VVLRKLEVLWEPLYTSDGVPIDVEAGWDSACALLSDGSVECWGDNGFGQLGNGSTNSSPSAVGVIGLTRPVTQLALSDIFSCALEENHQVQCWGSNNGGTLGDGTSQNSLIASSTVQTTGAVLQLTTTNTGACVLIDDGSVQCWGRGAGGGNGNGSTDDVFAPSTVLGLPEPIKTLYGSGVAGYHTCALGISGAAYCWGANPSETLGLPASVPFTRSTGFA
jgi:alpha-tubulin suppressor-like RCC1 family protein